MSISEIQGKVPVKIWSPLHEVESEALTQLRNVASLPWVFEHVAAMPDVHAGKGATVGSVIPMLDAVAPSAVGVDIGCGMAAVQLNLHKEQLPSDLKTWREEIERRIPTGFNEYEHPVVSRKHPFLIEFNESHDEDRYEFGKIARQLGTLGGGNHFIEICLDEVDMVWVMLHSGSRNIGQKLAIEHIRRAKTLEHNKYIVDRELSVFLKGTSEFYEYMRDVDWAQRYAWLNRALMLERVLEAIEHFVPNIQETSTIVNCHHNYVVSEKHFGKDVLVTRKGAIRAGKDELGIIPGSMGARSYIVRGLGSAESFESASHGAGRRMSRSGAKRAYEAGKMASIEEQLKGIECRRDKGIIDELPSCYKDIDQVMKNQEDLVEPVHELRQVLCIKG